MLTRLWMLRWQAGLLPAFLGLAVLLAWAAPVDATPTLESLSICIWEDEVPPYTSPVQEAESQQILHRILARQGLVATFVARPWKRCIKETIDGRFHGLMPVAPTRDYQQLAFPRRQGRVDTRRALGISRIRAIRLRGSEADWDGRRFRGLRGPVVYLHGISAPKVFLDRHGVASTPVMRTETMEQMLLHGRSNLAVDLDHRLQALMHGYEYAEGLEILPRALLEVHMYLVFNQGFYQANEALAERIWQSIAELRSQQLR